MNVTDAILLGSTLAAVLAGFLGHRFGIGSSSPPKPPPVDPAIAVVGGALADTLAIKQNTDAILKLAASHDTRSVIDQINGDAYKKRNELLDSAIDELILIRRALQELAAQAEQRRR